MSATEPAENGESAPRLPPEPAAGGRRTRLKRVAIITAIAVVFVLISGLLARWLQVENTERDDDLALIESQAKGDVQGMLAKLSGCSTRPACVAQVRANTSNPRLLRKGSPKILQLQSSTAYSITGSTGKTRLAWTVIGRLPVVQCVQVRRTGNPISGIKVTLLALSTPIDNEGNC